jgi:hypothetical protein
MTKRVEFKNGRWPKSFLHKQLKRLMAELTKFEQMAYRLDQESREPITQKDIVDCASDIALRRQSTLVSQQIIREITDTRSAIKLITQDLKSMGESIIMVVARATIISKSPNS